MCRALSTAGLTLIQSLFMVKSRPYRFLLFGSIVEHGLHEYFQTRKSVLVSSVNRPPKTGASRLAYFNAGEPKTGFRGRNTRSAWKVHSVQQARAGQHQAFCIIK